MSKIYWGVHQIINARGCSIPAISSRSTLLAFNARLIGDIGMVAYGDPFLQSFGEKHLKGYTLIQPIHTSSITCHFAEETGDAYLDIFSCKNFNPETVKLVIQDYFKPIQIDSKVIWRQAGIRME